MLGRVRFAIGVGCVIVAVGALVLYVPRTVRSMNDTARASPKGVEYRSLYTGDTLGIPFTLQSEAISLIPPHARYALLLPASQDTAAATYGIGEITYVTVLPWLRYLLLPALPVENPKQAQYIICWGCNTAPWDHHTT